MRVLCFTQLLRRILAWPQVSGTFCRGVVHLLGFRELGLGFRVSAFVS